MELTKNQLQERLALMADSLRMCAGNTLLDDDLKPRELNETDVLRLSSTLTTWAYTLDDLAATNLVEAREPINPFAEEGRAVM
jgi:hypothetical protein